MAETTEDSGATGAAAGGAASPFRTFKTEDDFNAWAAKIRHEAERKAKGLSADEREKLEAISDELAERKAREAEREKNYAEAQALREKQAAERIAKAEEKLAKASAALHDHLVNGQLRALAKANGAYSEDDVVARLSGLVFVDENFQVRVRSTDGTGAVQDGVSLESAVQDLLKANPHLVKATGGRSAGTTGGASVGAGYTGTPAQREAQARYDEALKAAAANPMNSEAMAAVLSAKAALKQAAS